MSMKSLVLAAASVLALCGVSLAATNTTPSSAGIVASKAGTEVEKAVGAGDTFTKAQLKSAMSLAKVQDPKDKLATAKVDDPKGDIIGPVKAVLTDKNGMATAIQVDVGGWLGVGERVVSISAKNFTYLPSRDILLTRMSKMQVKKLSPIKS